MNRITLGTTLFRLTSTAALAMALSAASSIAYADDTTVINFPHVEPVSLTFSAFDPQHVLVGERTVLDGIAQAVSAATRWPLRADVRDTSDSVLDTGERTRLDVQSHTLQIEYLAISRYLSGGSTGTTLAVPVAYTVTRTNDLMTVVFVFPDQAASVRHGMPLLTRKLWATNEILDDYTRLAERLKSVEIPLVYQATGELEAKYKPDAVLGNFERLLGRPTYGRPPGAQIGSSGSVTREGVFVYTDHGTRREVRISSAPYHDGSKVGYAASIPYTLRSDGTVAGDEAAMALRDLLTKVVSD